MLKVGNFIERRKKKKKINFYTHEEFELYIKEAKKYASESESANSWGYYVFFMIAFYTGARKGEINALQWRDVFTENGYTYISITKNISQKVPGKDDVEVGTKTATSDREVRLPDGLIDVLKEHKERQKKIFDRHFSEKLLICGGTKALRDTSISNLNTRFAKAAGLKRIRIHDFRHSHASLLVNQGINILEVAKRLGHSNTKVTWDTYSHLYPKESDKAVQVLNECFGEKE